MEGTDNKFDCCARDCMKRSRRTFSDKDRFFNLPVHDPERCIIWIENMEREDLLTKTMEELESNEYRICSKHFDHSQFVMPQSLVTGLTLEEDAIPTLFVPQVSRIIDVPTITITVPKQVAAKQNDSSAGSVTEILEQTNGKAITQVSKTGSSEVTKSIAPRQTFAMTNENEKNVTATAVPPPIYMKDPRTIYMKDNPTMTKRLKKENDYMLKDVFWYLERQKRLSSKLYKLVSKLNKLRNDTKYLVDFELLNQTLQNAYKSKKQENKQDIWGALNLIEALKKEFQNRFEESEYSMMEKDETVTVGQNKKDETVTVGQNKKASTCQLLGDEQVTNSNSNDTSEAEIGASTFSTKRLEPCPVSLHFRLDRSKFHFLSKLPHFPKGKRKCLVCQEVPKKQHGAKSKVKVSIHQCNVCQVPLCVEPCYYLFHTTSDYMAAHKDYLKGLVSLPLPSNDSHPSLTNYSHSAITVSQEEEENKSPMVDEGEDNSVSSWDDQSSRLLDPSAGQIGPNDHQRNDFSTNENKRIRKRKNNKCSGNNNESIISAYRIKKKLGNDKMYKKYLSSLPSGQTECICEKCGRVMTGKYARPRMLTHIRGHNVKIIECKICGQKLRGQQYVKRHMERHDKDKTRCKCTICGKVVKQWSNMKRHLRSHTGIKPFMCEICGRSFTQKTTMQQHVKSHKSTGATIRHGRKLKPTDHTSLGIPHVKCLVCDESHCLSIGLINHLKTHEGIEVGEGMGTIMSLEDLVNRHIGHYEQQLPFTCEFCVNKYTTLPFLQEHVNVSHRSKNNVCSGEKDFQKLTKYLEERHKRFFCTECGLSCSNIKYKDHMRIHSGERPFKCPMCPKTFSHRTPFMSHKRAHMGFKPFKCQYCTKEYSQKLDFVNHLKKIHGIEYKKGDKSHEIATTPPIV